MNKMDKVATVVGVTSFIGLVTIGFIMKPIVTGVVLVIVAFIGWHDDYYLKRRG